MKRPMLIYSKSNDGHRAEYNELLLKELSAFSSTVEIVSARKLPLKHDLFFSMIEEDPFWFVICSLIAIVSRKKVIGLLFRPGECVAARNSRLLVKYLLLRLIRIFTNAETLTILPFSLDKRFSSIATNWVYDFQLWDISAPVMVGRDATTPISTEIKALAHGRKIVVAIGAQNEAKGFHLFGELWGSDRQLREAYLFVSAGRVSNHSTKIADALRSDGAVVIDRYIDQNELFSLYNIADYIWAVYSPIYDQASGVAGRALQFRVPALVRRGSYISSLMESLEHPIIEVDHTNLSNAAEEMPIVSKRAGHLRDFNDLRSQFNQVLSRIFGSSVRHNGNA